MDARLLGRPRVYGGNSQEWNAVKFVFSSYIGVVAHPMLAGMIHAGNEPILLSGLSPEDAHLSRSLSFLLAQVLSGPPLQLMMIVGDQNGLEVWRLLVRSEQPVSGANRIAAVQMPAEIRTHLDLQTFVRTADLVNLMSSLSKMRTAATSSSSAGHGPAPMEIGWVMGKGQGKSKNKEKGKGEGKKNPRARSSRDGATTAESGVSKPQTVGMEKRNRCTKCKVKLVRRALSSSQCTLSATDACTKEIRLIESVCEDAEMSWIFMVADAGSDQSVKRVSEELCHSRDSGSTAGMLARFGSSISKWQDAQSLGNARGGVQRDGSARQSVHCENPLCL